MTPREPEAPMGVVRSARALRARVDDWRTSGLSVAFVPTMGALHAGHLSLVKRANSLADRSVVSIFVNPRQFAPTEDFAAYPRSEAEDLDQLQEAGCSLAYLPPAEEIYPADFQTWIEVGALAKCLCGASRPHFFGGVATVVCKLFNQCRPHVAVFGEKDYQQLLIIRRMAKDLDFGVEIVGAPIVREDDGLAMSSRNRYLGPEERAVAGRLNRVIADLATRLGRGAPVGAVLEDGRARLMAAGFSAIDYLEVRSATDLAALGPGSLQKAPPARVFAAVFLGKTRLIDNWPAAEASP